MKTIEVEGHLRADLGKSATKELRKEDKIPCVIYGQGENVHFYTGTFQVRDLIYTDEFRKASIKVDGKEIEAIIKSIQYHPVTDKIMHIDFQALTSGKAVKTELPLKLVGTSEGQKIGGTLMQKLRKLQVKVTPEGMTSYIVADISHLDLGKSMRVRDIKIEDGVDVMSNGSIPIASIEIPRALRSAQSKEGGEEEEEV